MKLILFAVGFSVAFLMIAGLAINEVGSIIGFSLPLSTLPLSLTINTLIIVGAAAAHLRRGKTQQTSSQNLGFRPSYLLLSLIPLLSVVGAYLVNLTGNSIILLIMIVAIALLFIVGTFYDKTTNIYPFAILMVGLALLFQVTIASNYLLPYGGDSPAELYVFRLTQISSHWSPTFTILPSDQVFGRYNAMLSITILPTIYSNILGMDPTWIYKIVYPMIFALVPVALYVLWQGYIGKKFAFAAAFLFMAESTFYTGLTALNRQMIGELFFVLLLLVLLNKKIRAEGKFIAFAVFSLGLIFSHYALAEIFFFLIFAAWATTTFYLKRPSFNLQFSMVIFFFVAMFGWYIYTSGAVVFDSFLSFASYVLSQLGGFFNPASREERRF